jgi:Myo-inositol oxygenase
MLSWGHDEVGPMMPKFSFERAADAAWVQYLYHVLKGQSSLPEEGLAMIRYHSFYPYVYPRFSLEFPRTLSS